MSTFVAKDGTQIYFKDWGSGKPVLFSHGWPLDADMWEYQMEYLSSRGYRTIAFDRRGFGRSDQPWTGNDYDTFADDIAQLIEHLDLKEVTLVGFSMGGGDVARYIARHGNSRLAGLVLLGAVTPIFGQKPDYPQVVQRLGIETHHAVAVTGQGLQDLAEGLVADLEQATGPGVRVGVAGGLRGLGAAVIKDRTLAGRDLDLIAVITFDGHGGLDHRHHGRAVCRALDQITGAQRGRRALVGAYHKRPATPAAMDGGPAHRRRRAPPGRPRRRQPATAQ